MNKYLENQDVFLISGGYTYLWAYPDNLLSGDAAKTTKAPAEERQILWKMLFLHNNRNSWRREIIIACDLTFDTDFHPAKILTYK